MIAFWAFNAMTLLCNCAFASSLVPIKDDSSLRLFKESPNEFEYVLKRHGIENPTEELDLKQRRNTGSSYIRFGRSQSEDPIDNSALKSETDSKVSRHPRWKTPDIVIRFGRSGFKTPNGEQIKRDGNDLDFIRFGRNIRVASANLDLFTICSTIKPSDVTSNVDPTMLKLFHLCNDLNKFTGKIISDDFDDRTDSNPRE